MSFWTAMVVMFAIAAFAAIRIERIRARDRAGAKPADLPSPRESELEREVIALRKRLEVVERIATEANSLEHRTSKAVAAEIESLRDR